MSFEIDQATYRDLTIFQDGTGNSIFSILDKTKTQGGKLLLLKTMQEPTSDLRYLLTKRDLIHYFYSHNLNIEITYHQLDTIDHYLSFNKKCLNNNPIDAIYDYTNYKINPSQDYYRIIRGINELVKLFSFF